MSGLIVVPVPFQPTVIGVDEKTSVVVSTAVGPKGADGAGTGADLSNIYTKTEVNNLLATKANTSHSHLVTDISDFNTALINGGVF